MKKFLILLLLFIFSGLFISANAVEIKIQGKGYALLTGYDIKDVRSKQDRKMKSKANNSDFEVLQTQQIKEAARQAETRKKQDKRMENAVRTAIVTEAQNNALKAALNILIDRTLGANASQNLIVVEKFDDILSQADTYIIDESYNGEIEDNYYVAHLYLTIDETEFRNLLSDLGVAINTQTTRTNSIMVILDEFFARPSNLSKGALTKETTTYNYNYDEKHKESLKASAKNSGNIQSTDNYAGYYGAGAQSASASYNSGANLGAFLDYSQNENQFYQNIKEYDVLSPKAENLNYTEPALQEAFTLYDIRSIDNQVFKSKYFKGQPVTSDKLVNSKELANYVNAARKDAKADYFAIGVSYITDNGINESTGKNTADGSVFVKVYSTADSEVIASGTFTETAFGNSADQARSAVAKKIGNELGEILSKKIQDYWKRRLMYGREYVIQIKGSFMPVEKAQINNALGSINTIKNISTRISDSEQIEFTVNYSGQGSIADEIFMKLYNSNLSNKFKNYDYAADGNQIIFKPIK